MYFDDATITDWASSKGSGQYAFEELNKLLGTPFVDEKKQTMAVSGTFLGFGPRSLPVYVIRCRPVLGP